MYSNASRWQRMLGIMVTLIMVFALVTPSAVDAHKAPASPTATEMRNTKFYQAQFSGKTNGTAAQIAERMYGPSRGITETLTGKGAGPFKEQVGGWNLPWAKPKRNTVVFPRPNANGTNTENRKKIYDEAPSPGLYSFWEGLNQGSNRTLFGFGFLPPDTTGDSSGNVYNSGYYVQTVNTTFAVWDYSQANVYGGWPKTVLGPLPINTLWQGTGTSCEATNDGDPIVRYDEQANRWIITQFALPAFDGLYPSPFSYAFAECIAVSMSGDPTGGYYLYEFVSPLTGIDDDGLAGTPQVTGFKMPDYPKFGIYQNGYYMTVNQFDEFNFNWAGAGLYIFDRASMLAGGAAGMVYWDPYSDADCSAETLYTTETDPRCFMGGMLPADNDGSWANGPYNGFGTYIMQFDDDAFSTPAYTVPDALEYWDFGVDWGVDWGYNGPFLLPVDSFDSDLCGYARNCMPQPGTTSGLAAISDRLMDRLNYRIIDRRPEGGPLYEVMVTNHTVDVNGADHAGVRWYELRRYWTGSSWDPWGVYQQGTYAPDSNNRWMGSMAVDAVGNLALGYTVGSSTVYPTIRYTTHAVGDPLGTMRDEVAITSSVSAAGSQTSSSHRWGDYSAMVVAGDGCDFIYTSEYLRGTTPAEWYTRMGNFGFDTCFYDDVEGPYLFFTITPGVNSPYRYGTFDWAVDYEKTGLDYYQCSLDGGAWFSCSPAYNYSGLSTGPHTFEVRGVDVLGNIGEPIDYSWNVTASTAQFTSVAPYDGTMVESSEFSNIGGLGSTATSGFIQVGDQTADRQLKGLMHFNVALPVNAVITDAYIRYTAGTFIGTNPFTTHGPLTVDMSPAFGGSIAFAASDFQAAAVATDVATCASTPAVGVIYYCQVKPAFWSSIGNTTQFRFQFTLDDNDDGGADLLQIASGNYFNVNWRPLLIVDYYVP